MRSLLSDEQKAKLSKYEGFKRLIRNMRRGTIEKVSDKETYNYISKISGSKDN